MFRRRWRGAGVSNSMVNPEFTSVVAGHGSDSRRRNTMWAAVNGASAHRSRDWTDLVLSAPDAAARFDHRDGDTAGINARSTGVYNMVRDIKVRGRAGRPGFRRWSA